MGAAIQAQVARLAGEGYRVLAVAQRAAGRRTRLDARLVTRLEFLGLLALADPVRSQAAAAVAGLREARVKVMMMTGDHPSTAESVAQELDMLAASATSAATLAGIVQTPGVSQCFGCRPLGPVGWATALGASGLGIGAAQIASALTRPSA